MSTCKDSQFDRFLQLLETWPAGYHTGQFEQLRYGVTIERPVAGKITKLFARELGGSDIVSFNLFSPDAERPTLKPCEMLRDKAINFVLGFRHDSQSG